MQRYLRLFAPIQLFFGMVVNVYAANTAGQAAAPTNETLCLILLLVAGIGLLSRLDLRQLRLKPVRIRNRKRRR